MKNGEVKMTQRTHSHSRTHLGKRMCKILISSISLGGRQEGQERATDKFPRILAKNNCTPPNFQKMKSCLRLCSFLTNFRVQYREDEKFTASHLGCNTHPAKFNKTDTHRFGCTNELMLAMQRKSPPSILLLLLYFHRS